MASRRARRAPRPRRPGIVERSALSNTTRSSSASSPRRRSSAACSACAASRRAGPRRRPLQLRRPVDVRHARRPSRRRRLRPRRRAARAQQASPRRRRRAHPRDRREGRLDVAGVPQTSRAGVRFERVRFERVSSEAPYPSRLDAADLTPALVRASVLDAARWLAHGARPDGRFTYLVDAPSGRPLAGYDWPRHAGATYFVADVAAYSADAELRTVALRALGLLRDGATADCGSARCITDRDAGDDRSPGSSALALLAASETVRSSLDVTFLPFVRDLARGSSARCNVPTANSCTTSIARTECLATSKGSINSGEAALALARGRTASRTTVRTSMPRRAPVRRLSRDRPGASSGAVITSARSIGPARRSPSSGT